MNSISFDVCKISSYLNALALNFPFNKFKSTTVLNIGLLAVALITLGVGKISPTPFNPDAAPSAAVPAINCLLFTPVYLETSSATSSEAPKGITNS